MTKVTEAMFHPDRSPFVTTKEIDTLVERMRQSYSEMIQQHQITIDQEDKAHEVLKSELNDYIG